MFLTLSNRERKTMPGTSAGEILQAVDLNGKAALGVKQVGKPTNTTRVKRDENEKPKSTSQLRWALFDTSKTEARKGNQVTKASNKVENEGTPEVRKRLAADVKTAQNLNHIASGHALRGNETTAIKMYQRAIQLTTCELDRIEKRMEKHMQSKNQRKQNIYSELFSEWKDVALIAAETTMMMAVLYERMGDYDAAILTCKQGSAECARLLFQESNEGTVLDDVHQQFFLMNHMVTKLEEAKETYQERNDLHEAALQMYNETPHTQDGKDRDTQYDAVLDNLFAALSLEMNSLGEHHPQVSATHAFISQIYLKKNDRTKALQSMKYAVGTAEIALGVIHPKTADKYYELARQYEGIDRNQYDQAYAMLYYQKALDAFEQAEGNHSRIIVAILNDAAVLLLKTGDHKDAIQQLRRAIAIYESMESEKEDVKYADIAQVWRNLARCYVIDKQWDMAEMNFSSALYVQRAARKVFDTSTGQEGPAMDMPFVISDECIVDTMKRMGKLYTSMQEYDKADRILIEALTVYQDACEEFKAKSKGVSPLELAARQDRIAEIIFCLAKVQEAMNSSDDAIRLYEEAMELRVYSDKVRDTKSKLNHVHIAMCLAGIGRMRLAKREFSTAFKVLNEAIQNAMKEELPEYHPIVQMLWDKSRMAAKGMEDEQDSHREFLRKEPVAPTTLDHHGGDKKDEHELETVDDKASMWI